MCGENQIVNFKHYAPLYKTVCIEGFRGKQSIPPVILITAFGDEETHVKAREFGAITVLDKPFEVDDLLAIVRENIHTTQTEIQRT